jgi:hypothetical protein
MLFYTLHNIIHNLIPGKFTDQTRNLITFLLGIILYTILYTYLFDKNNNSTNLIVNSFKAGFAYIIMSDCIAMGIVYKNYYKTSILNEVKEAWSDAKVSTNINDNFHDKAMKIINNNRKDSSGNEVIDNIVKPKTVHFNKSNKSDDDVDIDIISVSSKNSEITTDSKDDILQDIDVTQCIENNITPDNIAQLD